MSNLEGIYGNFIWVVLIGLFYIVYEEEIFEFFKGFDVCNVYFMLYFLGNWVGRKNGMVYVEFKFVGDCI